MESRAPAGRITAALRWLAAPLGFAVTAVVATWPMVTKLGSHLPGYGPNTDNLFHLVFSRWFAVALGHGQNPYHVWWTLFPAGSDSFLGKNGTCFNAALSAPLQPLFGVLAAVNLTAMGLLAFNGWAAFRLVLHLTRHRAAAFLAGVVLMMVPYNASMLGALSYDQLSVGWALTFLLYLLRTVEEPGWRAPALAGLFFFLTCFSFLGYGLIFGGVGALVLAWMLIARRARPDRHLLGRLALAALLTGALCAPLALAFKLSGGASSVDPAAAGSFPIALTPSTATLARHANRIVLEGSLRWRDLLALQGVAALLAASGLILKPRRAALWAVLALGFYVLALGPYLEAGGHWVPLPGLVIYHLGGVFSRFRFPFRFVIVTWVAVAVLAGLGARALAQRWARTPRRALVALAAVLAALAVETALRKDSLLPIPHFRAPEVPRYYREVLAQQPRRRRALRAPAVREAQQGGRAGLPRAHVAPAGDVLPGLPRPPHDGGARDRGAAAAGLHRVRAGERPGAQHHGLAAGRRRRPPAHPRARAARPGRAGLRLGGAQRALARAAQRRRPARLPRADLRPPRALRGGRHRRLGRARPRALAPGRQLRRLALPAEPRGGGRPGRGRGGVPRGT
ncbi:MAG: hypothetical protein ABIO70_11495 [Pseudomonadota bacterium]